MERQEFFLVLTASMYKLYGFVGVWILNSTKPFGGMLCRSVTKPSGVVAAMDGMVI